MSAKNVKVTEEQIKIEINALKNVFTLVRLLPAEEVGAEAGNRVACECSCFSVWHRQTPCRDCISRRSIIEKKQFSKIEKVEDGIFQVIADYREVDGKPCVLEMVKRFDDFIAVDYGDEKKNVESLSQYFEKTYIDVLTGAYNRRYYEEYISNSALDCGVAMLDLDDFKLYNDLYGHDVGDAVLKAVAATIIKSIRLTDKVVRYGGDEFLLIIPDIKEIALRRCLGDISESVRQTILEKYPAIRPSVSVGGVVCSGETIKEAVLKADEFMYVAKKKKGCVVTRANDKSFMEDLPQKERVLVVDDSGINREILTGILKSEYDVIEAVDGDEAIEQIERYKTNIAVVLLDLIMPGTSGFDVLDYMNDNGFISDIPVITITGDDSGDSMCAAYEKGVSDYITRPFDARIVYRRVVNTVKVYTRQKRLISEITRQSDEKEKSRSMIVEILSRIIERPHGGSGEGHTVRITEFTRLILERLVRKNNVSGLYGNDISVIATAAALHDVGKARIDRAIVDKKGKLTPEEFEIMKTHTTLGDEMLKNLKAYAKEPLVRYAREICLCHHERYDGGGYPNGLKGDEIPLSAQVVAVCDVYDALISERSYKPSYPHEKAIEMIKNGECGAFNPLVLESFYECADKFRVIAEESKK